MEHAPRKPSATDAKALPGFLELPPEWRPPDPASPRGRILAAARLLFAQHGLRATTTRAIAGRAKVNLAMIHYYYGSKEALYERVLAQEFIVVVQGMSAHLPPDLPEHEIIITLPIRIMSVLRHNPTWITLLRHEVGLGGVHVLKALKSLGGLGPLGLRQFFDHTYAQAVASGRLRALPVNPLRECLLALSWGTVLMQPFFEQMFQSNLFDETTWTEYHETLKALLRRGLQVENET
ncbi:MAG: helix-turn-helix domain containing protein [bacterium]|nr:helix-turn-helix domain containing protein [bacterium]